MGGKDTIVVDETSNLDEAAACIVASAFGYSGQKCSACSRAVIVSSVYDQVVAKIADRVSKLTVGPVKDVDNFTGPVSSKRAYEKINKYIEIGQQESRVVEGGGRHEMGGEGSVNA